MSAIRLLVLGDVRLRGRAHGYQVRNDLEFWGAHEWSTAKPGSIYHALKQLAKQGLLLAHDTAPSTAGGPPRTEYEITEAGGAEFFRLLRHALTATQEKQELLTAAIGFLVDLPRDEAVELLRQRVAALEGWRQEVTRNWAPDNSVPQEWGHIGEIMKLWVHTADSDAAWARELIARLEAGAFVMAGEGERDLSVLSDGRPGVTAREPRSGQRAPTAGSRPLRGLPTPSGPLRTGTPSRGPDVGPPRGIRRKPGLAPHAT